MKRRSLFDTQEIRDYSNQEALASQQQSLQEAPSLVESFLDDGGLLSPASSRRDTVIDDAELKRMMSDASPDRRRYSMDPRLRVIFLLVIALVVVYVASIVLPDRLLSALFNPNTQTFGEVLKSNFQILAEQLSGQAASGLEYSDIVISALVALTGAGLAAIGASYQVTFRNQLATPSSLGVMSGAAFGSALFYILHQGEAAEIASRVAITQEQVNALATDVQANSLTVYLNIAEGAFYSMAGAFAVVALTVLISKIAGHGKLNNAVLIIAGQVFASLANAFIVLFRLYLETTRGQQAVQGLATAQIGDLSSIGRTYDLLFMGVPIVVGLVVLMLLSGRMNAIALSGDDARALGLRVDAVRIVVIALSTVITAVIVAFVGSIGFVGFAVPQIVRRFIGPNFRYLLPASALAGASFLLVVNYVYSSFSSVSGGIGVFTSLIGGVVFVFSIVQQRKVASGAE